MLGDRSVTVDMLARVVAAGYGAMCLTVDLPVFGLRHRDTRNGFEPPLGGASSRLPWDSMMSWDDIAWLRERNPDCRSS